MYCLATDIERRLGSERYDKLALVSARGEDWDSIVEDAITEASGLVDSYLMKQYFVPVGDATDDSRPVPLVIRNLTTDIALYLLWKRVGQAEKQPDIREGFHNAIDRLKDIAFGKAEIPSATKDTENRGADYGTEDRVFTADDMKGF